MKPILFAAAAILAASSASAQPAPAGDYPPCSAMVTDHCVQTWEGGGRHAMDGMGGRHWRRHHHRHHRR